MKWRCTWCGKPHEANDPPCDNCGHGEFEAAIVREREFETVDTGPTYVWACPNCGREHVKNTPPCSRCGNPELEKVEQSYEDVERDLEVPGWLDVAKPYLPIFAVVAVVLALFATGIVPPSVLPGVGASTPAPPDAPGEGEAAAGIAFDDVEAAVHEGLADERRAADAADADRAYDDGLAALATYRNRDVVAAHYEGDQPDGVPSADAFDPSCPGPISVSTLQPDPVSIDAYDSGGALADAVVASLVSGDSRHGVVDDGTAEAVDVHVGPDPDRAVFVTYARC